MKRFMALDVGEKRIGIAISDPLGIIAQGLETYSRIDINEDIIYLRNLFKEYDITRLIVGLPKNMNNSIGFKALEIQEFIQALMEGQSIPVHWIDERLTTKLATKVLLDGNVSRKKRKKVVDKMAATVILQTYLDQV